MPRSFTPRAIPAAVSPAVEDDEDRPTAIPAFDPEAFARASENRQRAAIEGGESTIDQARRLHAGGEHERALFLVTRLLELTPSHAEASALAGACRVAIERACVAAIGSPGDVLVSKVSPSELRRFALDPVAGFLFSRIDGATTVEEVLDICGLPRAEALRHLANLRSRGIVGVRGERSPLDPVVTVEDDGETHSGVLPIVSLPRTDAIPMLLLTDDELAQASLDAPDRALLEMVDDHRTLEQIVVDAGLDLVDGTLAFERLAEEGYLTFA